MVVCVVVFMLLMRCVCVASDCGVVMCLFGLLGVELLRIDLL